jgi:RNA polymerase sigma-54 factor
LSKLQKFDPPGIFARNLKECLIIQLNIKNIKDQSLTTLIDNLELLAKNEFKKLQKICAVDNVELKRLIEKIKMLNPKPANGFDTEQIIHKIPDVILTIEKDFSFKLAINPESTPKLRFNDALFAKIRSSNIDRESKRFAKAAVNDATGIVKAIENRANTILRVASAIIAEQIDFFNRGVMYLKPLTLVDIARITGLNESTISRSTAKKYIQTPNGVYELKYFFSSGLSSTKHLVDAVSSTKVKEIIKQIILSEEQGNVLSDDAIAYELKKFNIKIARRTVAKYREEAGFPTSAMRKKSIVLKK